LKVLVAGATGVLGRGVVRLLLERRHEVRGLSRSAANDALLLGLGAQPFRADLFDPDGLRAAAAGVGAVLHLATAIPTRRRVRRSDFALNDRIRTEGTHNLLAAALAGGARRYVQQSVAFLHHNAGEEWADEDSPVSAPPVLESCIEMERMVWQSQGLEGIGTVILRAGSFYGPEAAHTRRMFAALKSGLMPLVGSGDNYWSLIHTDDMAAAVVAAAEAQRPERLYLVVDDQPVRLQELFAHVAHELGGRPPRSLPAWLVSLLAGPLAPEMLRASFRCRNARIKKDLGWKPAFPTYREGVSAILRAWGAGARSR
jgi:nucleoside-diphosphate-sugar epimerase